MKLIKAIKLFWRLRIRQEYACFKVCQYSQDRPFKGGHSPYLYELGSLNKAVNKVGNKIPKIFFLLSDLFGGASVLKRQCNNYAIEQEKKNGNICPKCGHYDIYTSEQLRRTNGPRVQGKLMSYGFRLEVHQCNKCKHIWDGKKLNL